MLERDRLASLGDQALVDDVEHLEERGVLVDVVGRIGLEPARVVRSVLSPHVQGEVHHL